MPSDKARALSSSLRLTQHGGTGLLQDLRASHVGNFCCVVRIFDA